MQPGCPTARNLIPVAALAAAVAACVTGAAVASSAAAKPRTFAVSIVGSFDYSTSQPSCSPSKVRGVARFKTTTRVVATYAGGRLTLSGSQKEKATRTAALFTTSGTNAVTRELGDGLPACATGGAANTEKACVVGTPRAVTGARAHLRIVAPTGNGSARGGYVTDPNFQVGVQVLGRYSKLGEKPPFARGCTGSLRAVRAELSEYEVTGCRATRAGEPRDTRCARIRPAQLGSTPIGRTIKASAAASGSSQKTTAGVSSSATYKVTWTVRLKRLS